MVRQREVAVLDASTDHWHGLRTHLGARECEIHVLWEDDVVRRREAADNVKGDVGESFEDQVGSVNERPL